MTSKLGHACTECRKSKVKCSLTSGGRSAQTVQDRDSVLEEILEEMRRSNELAEENNTLLRKLVWGRVGTKKKLQLEAVEVLKRAPKWKRATGEEDEVEVEQSEKKKGKKKAIEEEEEEEEVEPMGKKMEMRWR